MLESAPGAFATFFATIGPVEAAVLFASFRPRFSRAERIAVSLKATGIATAIILFFPLSGTGILLAAIAVQSVFNGIAGSGIFMRAL